MIHNKITKSSDVKLGKKKKPKTSRIIFHKK